MLPIQFTAAFGELLRKGEIVAPNGGNGMLHLYLDKYFCGQIIRRNEEWLFYMNESLELSAEDIFIITDIINEGLER